MTKLLIAGLLISAAALSACSKPNRYGEDGAYGAYGANGLNGANGINSGTLGGASDPASPQYFAQTIGDRILFGLDQSTLSGEAMQILNGQAQWLKTNSDYAVILEGHADELGTREYNVALGARRANAVREYLISQGIAPTRLRTVSYGKERPIEICSSESCYSKNRRAVTVISMGAVS